MAAKNTNIVLLSNSIQVALFNTVLLPEITVEGGRWYGVRTKGHAEPFATAKAVIAPEGTKPEDLGLQFAAPKRNYNFNDSNWVNPAANLERLMAVAKKANGGKEVTKKQLQQELEAIKNIFKASKQPIAEAVAGAAAVNEAQVQAAPATTEEQPAS